MYSLEETPSEKEERHFVCTSVIRCIALCMGAPMNTIFFPIQVWYLSSLFTHNVPSIRWASYTYSLVRAVVEVGPTAVGYFTDTLTSHISLWHYRCSAAPQIPRTVNTVGSSLVMARRSDCVRICRPNSRIKERCLRGSSHRTWGVP